MRIFALAFLIVAVFVSGCDSKVDKPVSKPAEPPVNVVYPKYSITPDLKDFNGFTGVSNYTSVYYFSISSDLTNDEFSQDTKNTARALIDVFKVSEGVDTSDLQTEAANDWRKTTESLYAAAKELSDSRDIEAARVAFCKMSFHLIERIKLFGHKYKEPVQIVYCSMAFNNRGARWLQEKENYPIRNPYFGREMLECGEKKELLAGRKK